jgi:hypothetical protein
MIVLSETPKLCCYELFDGLNMTSEKITVKFPSYNNKQTIGS